MKEATTIPVALTCHKMCQQEYMVYCLASSPDKGLPPQTHARVHRGTANKSEQHKCYKTSDFMCGLPT